MEKFKKVFETTGIVNISNYHTFDVDGVDIVKSISEEFGATDCVKTFAGRVKIIVEDFTTPLTAEPHFSYTNKNKNII